jgi:DNA invertase Pin-like site-specific DNA recombinase
MKVIGYIRVSTSGQAEDGLGLDVQRAAIHGWADRLSHELIEVIADEGISGTLQAHERPGLARALDLVRTGEVDAVVVHRLDRLARLLTVQEAALAAVWSADGRVFEVTGGEVLRDDPEDPMRTAIRQVMGIFSQLERATVVARMTAGRRLKAERGGYAGGAPGFGWTAQERDLVMEPDEQRTLQRVLELREVGLSWRKIAVVLADEGRTPKRAAVWHPETLRRLVLRASIG